jgi:hypothetical protein
MLFGFRQQLDKILIKDVPALSFTDVLSPSAHIMRNLGEVLDIGLTLAAYIATNC